MKVQKRLRTTSTRTLTRLTNNTHAASMSELEKQIEQHIGDNVDHDLVNLGGKSGFHGMELIKVTTPKSANQLKIDENRKMQWKKS